MTIKFSQTTGGFYDTEIHGVNIPADSVDVSKQAYAILMDGQSNGKRIVSDGTGQPILQDPPAPTPQQQQAINESVLQAEMDRQAQAKGYDGILSACSYAAQPAGSPFQAEGAAFLAWRSQVWQEAYAKLAQVQAGTAAMPTAAEAVAAMPTLTLPA